MHLWLFWFSLGASAQGSDDSDQGMAGIAHAMAWAPSLDQRVAAARRLQDFTAAYSREVGRAVAKTFEWAPNRALTFVGEVPLTAALELPREQRVAIATELMAWRVDRVLIGSMEIPPRLEAELRGMLGPEIEAHGQPTCTQDWLQLLGAAEGDLEALIHRLGLAQDGRWGHLVDQNHTLVSAELRYVLPLLAHRSQIVRSRAARRLEANPEASMHVLRRAWQDAKGRAAPLRGEVEVPVLPWNARTALKWSRTLVQWARRAHRQRDDKALHAALQLLATPEVTSKLLEERRVLIGRQLIRASRRGAHAPRSDDLVLAMDAVLRQVSLEEARRSAPEEHAETRPTWMRQAPGR